MPSETFFKLSEDKKNKILKAAQNEFSRVSFEQVSIKNIVNNAGIARGSFYQYFKDKEDLLLYIVKMHTEKTNNKIEKNLKEHNGDIFSWYIETYDFMIKNLTKKGEFKLFKNIFENIKASDEKIFKTIIERNKPNEIVDYYDLIDKDNLKINSKEELEIICKMLNIITRNAVMDSFRLESKEEAKKVFLKELEYIKYGVLKQK